MTHSSGGMQFAMPRLTPAVKMLLWINGAVFVMNMVVQGKLGEWGGASWAMVTEGLGLGLVRLISYQFIHDFYSPMHIAFNMITLYFFGTFVEEGIGRRSLVRLYLLGGIVGGVLHIVLSSAMGHDAPVVGASGSIYAIMVYAAFMAPRMRVIALVVSMEMRWLVGGLVAIGLYSAYVELVTGVSGGTSHGGHLGGALWGYLAYRGSMRATPGIVGRIQSWQSSRAHRSRAERQRILDELLDKVHREGLGALTPAERRFLEKTSRDLRG